MKINLMYVLVERAPPLVNLLFNIAALLLSALRRGWYIAAGAASILCFALVPFEEYAGEMVINFHVALLVVPVATTAWHFASGRKKQTSDNGGSEQAAADPLLGPQLEYFTIKHTCGHSSRIALSTVEKWISEGSISESDVSGGSLEVHASCELCSIKEAAKNRQKRTALPKKKIAASVIACVVLFAAGLYGFTSGIAAPAIDQISGIQNFISSDSAGDLLSGKGSVDDLASLTSAVPGGEQLQIEGIEPYSFSDGHVIVNGRQFALEVADTSEEKSRGLSFSEGLQPDQAFLVQYGQHSRITVSLLSADFAVDVLWLDGNNVVDIAEGVTECKVASLDHAMESSGGGCVYQPSASADSILYVDAGAVESAGIEKGDAAEFTD